MFDYVWPIALIVLSNTLYQICAKSIPETIHPLASVSVTYIVAAVFSLLLFFLTEKHPNLPAEYGNLNWAPLVLGIVIVGLEVGSIYAYQAGWPISTEQIVQAAVLAVLLIFVGKFLYHEPITWNKIVGMLICLAGLGLINLK